MKREVIANRLGEFGFIYTIIALYICIHMKDILCDYHVLRMNSMLNCPYCMFGVCMATTFKCTYTFRLFPVKYLCAAQDANTTTTVIRLARY